MPPPDVPPPTEERLFTNWSSVDSPRERVNQCNQSARSVESNRTVNQTEQPTIDPGDNEVLRYVLSDVMTTPSTQIQISQVGARFVDRETNTSEVEIRPPREEVRIDIEHIHSKGVQVPTSHSELSSHDTDIVESSLARLHIPDVMLQLDGPTSIHVQEEDLYQNLEEKPQCLEEVILMRVIVTLMIIDHMMNEDTLEGEDIIMIEVEGHQIEKIIKIEGIQEEEDPQMIEDPLMMVDPLMMEEDGGPPGKWKTSEMTWKTRTTRPTRTSWTSVPYHCTTTPGYIRYNGFGKYIWYCWPVNVAIG